MALVTVHKSPEIPHVAEASHPGAEYQSLCPSVHIPYISIARISMEHIFPKPKRYFWFDLLSVQSI